MDDSSKIYQGRPGERMRTDGGRHALDRVLEALADPRRRCICSLVQETDAMDLETLAAEVAAVEVGCSPAAVPAERLDRVQADLYHHQLPHLNDLGILAYDSRSGAVRYQHPPPYFEDLLQTIRAIEHEYR